MDLPDWTRVTSSEGVGGGWLKRIIQIVKLLELYNKTSLLAYSLIYDVIQCSGFDGDCDTLPPGRYGVRHIDRWSVSVASCEATR